MATGDAPVDSAGEMVEESARDALTRVFSHLHPPVEMDGSVGTALFHPQPEHRGIPGRLHGGMAATILDHVCARTAAAALGDRVVTGTLDLRYPRPVTLADGPYVVRAEHEPTRGTVVRVAAAILGADGRPMVEAKAMFVTHGS